VKQRKKKTKDPEVTRLGAALRALGGLGGSVIGNFVGQGAAGKGLGTDLGAMVSRWLGSGDYTVKSNSIVQRTLNGSNSIPAMHKTGQSIRVQHKEFLCEIKGSTGFNVGRFFILQPGDTNTFPWLSGIAPKFQEYSIKGMVFHYVPTSGAAISGTNPAIGSVMLQTSYRANDNAPLTKQEMLNEYWACEASPAEPFCHPIECDPKENPFGIHYVRTKQITGSDSPLLYDMGVLYVATSGMPATGNVVGDLWVTYDIELSKPIALSSVSAQIDNVTYRNLSPAPGNWFGSSGTTTGNLGCTFTTQTVSFPIGTVGSYLIHVSFAATTNFTAMDLSGSSTYTNCASLAFDQSGATYYRTVLAGTGTLSRGEFFIGVNLTDPSSIATVSFPAGTWTGAITAVDVVVSQLA